MRIFRYQYCKVIIATSLVWFLLDVALLMYFTDCTSQSADCKKNGGEPRDNQDIPIKPKEDKKDTGGGGGFLEKILPKEGAPAKQEPPVDKNKPAPPVVPVKKNPIEEYRKKLALQPRRVPTGPGEQGRAVVIPQEKKDFAKEQFKVNQFNLVASDMMSLNRSLPDYRMDQCKRKDYHVPDLPTTSVVIVFHNEAWSTLLRTVWSIITRSPRHLLKEIILVDDASEREFLKEKLDSYVAQLPVPVKVLRMGKRSGLIRARLTGAEATKGNVITFLDAHCECSEGWLEPLLYEIYKDRTSVVCPIIDVISDDTFEYITGSDMTWGGFNWKLNFRWYPVPQREMNRRNGDRSVPLRSPTMAGGLFAIDRSYFYEVGSYDPGMDIWGGENLEMSFRIWMCGGTVLIATCSRVGHVFRKVSPYSWPGGVSRILNHNTQRTAEVWMDDYKHFYYKISPGVRQTEYGDVSERLALRKKLQCKSFHWYLENIYPESQMPLDYYSLGPIKNKESGQCLDTMGRKNGEKMGIVNCHGMGGNQIFSYTKKKAFQTDDLCLDVSAINGPVNIFQCHGLGGNQQWEYDRQIFSYVGGKQIQTDDLCVEVQGSDAKLLSCQKQKPNAEWLYDQQTLTLKHANSNQCLDKPKTNDPNTPSVGPCNGSPSQQWILTDMDWGKM